MKILLFNHTVKGNQSQALSRVVSDIASMKTIVRLLLSQISSIYCCNLVYMNAIIPRF